SNQLSYPHHFSVLRCKGNAFFEYTQPFSKKSLKFFYNKQERPFPLSVSASPDGVRRQKTNPSITYICVCFVLNHVLSSQQTL
ncbi:MAG: hypothetical protein WCU80_07760, partial [Paludibacteraceae bacterium]